MYIFRLVWDTITGFSCLGYLVAQKKPASDRLLISLVYPSIRKTPSLMSFHVHLYGLLHVVLVTYLLLRNIVSTYRYRRTTQPGNSNLLTCRTGKGTRLACS